MKPTHMAVLAVSVLGMVTAARAAVIVGSTDAAFQTSGAPNENGKPYWDNPSLDGPDQNVGFQVENTYGSLPPWWGTTSGRYDTNFHFTQGAATTQVEGDLQVEIAGNASANEVGWYDTSDPTHAHHVIWTGADSTTNGADELFTPSENWGLYITGPGGTFYSDSALNSVDTDTQHFAVFATSPLATMGDGRESYDIGVEDSPATKKSYEGSGDYNDFVFSISNVPVLTAVIPEPASLALLGLAGAALLLRRNRRRPAAP